MPVCEDGELTPTPTPSGIRRRRSPRVHRSGASERMRASGRLPGRDKKENVHLPTSAAEQITALSRRQIVVRRATLDDPRITERVAVFSRAVPGMHSPTYW